MADVPEVIELNVGGVLYATTRTTLTRDPTSVLGRWFSTAAPPGDSNQQPPAPLRDAKGRYFVDRDGVLFRFVLDYLRNGRLVLPEAFSETGRLRTEIDFYGLTDLIRSLQTSGGSGAGGLAMRTSPSGQLIGRPGHVTPSNGDGSCGAAPLSPGLLDAEGIMMAGGRPEMGYVVVGYRGTFQFGRDGLTDVKFRKISRILVSGRVSLCRDVFGDTLNESRDPDRGSSDRYSARFFLKHVFIEQAFDALQESGFRMVGSCASGTNSAGGDAKPGMDSEENRWNHYNEFVFCRP